MTLAEMKTLNTEEKQNTSLGVFSEKKKHVEQEKLRTEGTSLLMW